MREIKFRGRDMSGHWVYGLLTKKKIRNSNKLQYAIATEDCSMGNTIPIIENTVGEFTGFKDIDGKEIFEGDIIQNDEHPEEIGKIINEKGCWLVDFFDGYDDTPCLCWVLDNTPQKVIGNIFDNPELLERRQN